MITNSSNLKQIKMFYSYSIIKHIKIRSIRAVQLLIMTV